MSDEFSDEMSGATGVPRPVDGGDGLASDAQATSSSADATKSDGSNGGSSFGPASYYGGFDDRSEPPFGQEPTGQTSKVRDKQRLMRRSAALAATALVGAAGIGVGHVVWPRTLPTTTSVGSSSTLNPPSGSTNPNAQTPFGTTNPNLFSPFGSNSPFVQSPFGESSPFFQGPSSGSAAGSIPEGSGGPSNVAAIAKKVIPGLVDVNSTFSYQGASGAGTGIVLTSNGEILTNNHVINGASSVRVTDIGNGRTYSATVVGYDPVHDLAVLQLKGASGLQTAHLGNSGQATVGEPVVAIGNAGGVGGTPTSAGGSITGLNQSITAADSLNGTSEHLSGMIQVNAAIQAGDSGGPLVNTSGAVIGVDTAAASGGPSSSQVEGLAIPINRAVATAKIIESGHGTADIHVGATGLLGVYIDTAASQGANPSGSTLLLQGTVSGGPAQQAGLAAGDVITSINGQPVGTLSALSALLIPLHPGDTLTVGWLAPTGQTQSASVTLVAGPPA